MTSQRHYPIIPANLQAATWPISFICVKYSDEFDHNILVSECIHDEMNEFIVVDNRSNVFFETLGQAINHGISQARNELIVFVHEDVVLLPGWHAMFEQSLAALARHDPDWQVLGAVGWDENGRLIGHSSDPHGYRNTFRDQNFLPAARIDEQILILRKSNDLFPDNALPGIHNIGRDIVWSANKNGGGCYVINAPPIHKYADSGGRLVLGLADSEKFNHRKTLTYKHNKQCSDEYLSNKWGREVGNQPVNYVVGDLAVEQTSKLDSPIILLGRGGSGTRLLSTLASDVGLFIGNENNPAGDCLELVGPIYRAINRKYRCPGEWQKSLNIPDLRSAAASMLERSGWPDDWGFKLPESLLVLPELQRAFPNARYALMTRDPLTTVLRRTHMTSRLDNEIGQIALVLAYTSAGLPLNSILTDSATMRMARGTVHQYGLIKDLRSAVPVERWHQFGFESMVNEPRAVLDDFAGFCRKNVVAERICQTIDGNRAFGSMSEFPSELTDRVSEILHPLRVELGYL